MNKTKFIEHLKEKEFPIEIETKNSSIKVLKIEEHHFNFNVNSKLIGVEGVFKAYQFYNDYRDNDYEKERIIHNLKQHLSYAVYGEVINEMNKLDKELSDKANKAQENWNKLLNK